jgi:hypothetical protein
MRKFSQYGRRGREFIGRPGPPRDSRRASNLDFKRPVVDRAIPAGWVASTGMPMGQIARTASRFA